MRDKQIDRVLKRLGKVWKQNPNLRFGQLLINLYLVKDDMETWNRADKRLEGILIHSKLGVIQKAKVR